MTVLDLINRSSKGGSNVQSDWNQNDPTAADYVKNRTHYVTKEIIPILETTEISLPEQTVRCDLALIYNETYLVIFDDVEYECTAFRTADGGIHVGSADLAGHRNTIPREAYSTDKPFCCSFFEYNNSWRVFVRTAETHIVEIKQLLTTYYPLNEKYLPSNVFINIVDGTASGSIRSVYSAKEGDTIRDIEGNNTGEKYTIGAYASVFGISTMAIGEGSFAEGGWTQAKTEYSHAEGHKTIADGMCAHTEGAYTRATEYSAHAEGNYTVAGGHSSHVEGTRTIASSSNQHVQGKYNIEDTTDTYAHIVGNGDYDAPSNAHTLDWNGNAWYQGSVYVGGTSQDDGSKLTTEADVIALIEDKLGVIENASY